MISRNKIKLIRSLSRKKSRDEHGLFMVEGEKMVLELILNLEHSHIRVKEVFATPEWIGEFGGKAGEVQVGLCEASAAELKSVSSLVTPQQALALVQKPEYTPDWQHLQKSPVLALDAVRDPGNLGTIIRTADWFGITDIVCSPDSVDCFNPKVVQATMGALMRVRVHYLELKNLIAEPSMREKEVLGTLLKGDNIYETELGKAPLVIFGNESRGLDRELIPHLDRGLTIPSFSQTGRGAESLNLASSVAVVCSELCRPTQNGNSASPRKA